MRVLDWVHAHFHAHRQRTKWDFLWRITLEGLFVPLCVAVILQYLLRVPERDDFSSRGILLFVEAVFLAPFFETLILQSFPVMIARSLGAGFVGQFLAAWIPFAALHFGAGIGAGVSAGVFGGFYIAFTYVHWRQLSFRSAFWMTCLTHALHNLVPGLILLFELAE